MALGTVGAIRRCASAPAALIVAIGLGCSSAPMPTTPSPTDSAVASPTNLASPIVVASVTASPAVYRLGQFPVAPTGSLPESTMSDLQAVLENATETVPGVSATVIAADIGIWSGAAGTSDGESALAPEHSFALASLTKTIIAAQVVTLAEQGLLDLADPASDHLPPDIEFDTNGATIRDLLAMESGIPDLYVPFSVVDADPGREWDIQEVLDLVPDQRTRPGSMFEYSNTNYMLLGLVLEHVTGSSVAAVLRGGVLRDPNFATLVYQPEEKPRPPVAIPHVNRSARPDLIEQGGGSIRSRAAATMYGAAGAMAGDADAVALWAYELAGGRIVSGEALMSMTDFGSGDDYDGYGLGVIDQRFMSELGTPAIGNGGYDDGYSSALTVLPDKGIVIVVLTNLGEHPRSVAFPIVSGLAEAL